MSGPQPILLDPVFLEKVWGGSRLRDAFGYDIPSSHTGECWAISGHPHGDCRVQGGAYDGMTLGALWQAHPELFGGLAGDGFPLLVKIIDAAQDLSIQVHPDDIYAREHEGGALGKTECWYVLDCDPGATIVIGHHAGSEEQFREMVDRQQWDELLREVPIQKGDFFQIDPGCLHAIKGGTMILETQQSSDTTYRFYDYGRLEDGKARPLHLRQCMDVTQVPFRPHPVERSCVQEGGASLTRLIACPYYTVYHAAVDGRWERDWDKPFVNISVIGGEGEIGGRMVEKGHHLLLPAGCGSVVIQGQLELICSHV